MVSKKGGLKTFFYFMLFIHAFQDMKIVTYRIISRKPSNGQMFLRTREGCQTNNVTQNAAILKTLTCDVICRNNNQTKKSSYQVISLLCWFYQWIVFFLWFVDRLGAEADISQNSHVMKLQTMVYQGIQKTFFYVNKYLESWNRFSSLWRLKQAPTAPMAAIIYNIS